MFRAAYRQRKKQEQNHLQAAVDMLTAQVAALKVYEDTSQRISVGCGLFARNKLYMYQSNKLYIFSHSNACASGSHK